VDGQAYDNNAMGHYYKAMKIRAALSEARSATADKAMAIAFPSGLVLIGAGVGFVGEYFSQWTNEESSSSQGWGFDYYRYYSTTNAGQLKQAALIGAGVGLALGAPLCAYFSARALQAPGKAADAFNRKLLKRLQLEAAPQAGGAAMKASLRF